MPHRIICSLALTVLLGLACTTSAADKIGVIYLERVFAAADLLKKPTEMLQQQASMVNSQVEAIAKELKEIDTELSTYTPRDTRYHELTEKKEVRKVQRKLFFERHRKRLDGLEMMLLTRSYVKIREVLDTYAAEKGFKLIMLGSRRKLASRNLTEFRLELATHAVQYHTKELDITDDFLGYLNEKVKESIDVGQGPADNGDSALDLLQQEPQQGPVAPPSDSPAKPDAKSTDKADKAEAATPSP